MEKTTVLVVEDNPASMKLLRLVLSIDGFQVDALPTAEAALDAMRARMPRAVVADIQLPGMNGLELARAVRAIPAWDDVVLVAVSAHATKIDEQRARSAGFADLIPKPIDTRRVSSRIGELLINHSTSRQRPLHEDLV